MGLRISLFSCFLLIVLLRSARSDGTLTQPVMVILGNYLLDMPPSGSDCSNMGNSQCRENIHLNTSSQLLKGINDYRVSLNLSQLTANENADCLAEQLASAYKGQDCTNTTGSDTVPGTEQQFSNFPDFLSNCHLNATVIRDGSIMPACVPGLDPQLVLANFTKSQYNQNLNDSSYVGIGLADEGNWVVAVLTTNTPAGNYGPATDTGAGSVVSVADHRCVMLLLLGFLMVLIS